MAVVGGGPAGSFFAISLLQGAQERGLDLEVDIYEPRSFAGSGPEGCNRCAGILSASFLKNLRDLGITIPDNVAQSHISSYQLYSPFGTAKVRNPDPEEDILSVYRGSGPLHPHGQHIASFDAFLSGQAQGLGARLVPQRVRRVSLHPRPLVYGENGHQEYQLVVLASGLNAGVTSVEGLPYRPPPTAPMAQDELYASPEDIQSAFGSSVKVFLFPGTALLFGTLVPKGHFINVSLLGGAHAGRVEDFLHTDLVKQALPFPYERSCGCQPRISVGLASQFYGDGFVAIGDACVTRLYKDGIGSALLTARQAAWTALDHGVSSRDFAQHYAPLCLAIHRDNHFGRAIFAAHRRLKDSPAFFRAQSRLLASEQSRGGPDQPLGRTLWGIFTGSYHYRAIAGMALQPSFGTRLAMGYLGQKLVPGREAPASAEARPATPAQPKKILVLGGGFGGVYTALGLERALSNRPDISLTLVSDENFFLFTPMLQEVATGGIETRHIAYPIRRLRRGRNFQFVQSRVLSVDLHHKTVTTEAGLLGYDYLVLALGSVTDMAELPRQAQNVFTLKTLLDGLRLRNHIISMLEQADIEADPQRRKQLLTFVVAGGGYTGIQLITEIGDFVRGSILGQYRSLRESEIAIILVESQDRILPGKDQKLSQKLEGILKRQGIQVRANSKITDLRDDALQLNGQEWLPTNTLVWATGIRANPVVACLPVGGDHLGRVEVNEFLQVPGFPGVYALGDNACIEDPTSGQALPPRAHFAVRQPKVVVANILAELGGRPKKPYRWNEAIEMISLGPRNASLSIGERHFFGLPVRLLWVLGYLALVRGRYNQIRILMDWLLILFFGRDSTLLQIERAGPWPSPTLD